MSFASVGSFGTANSTTSDTTLALTPTVTIEAGNLAMLVISADNMAVNTLPAAEFGHKIANVASVTDTGGNTWHKLGEVATNQAAAAGNAVALYYCILTTQLTTSSTITITFGTAITSKAATGWEFTIGGSALAVERIRFRGTAGADPPSMTLDDLPSREYLFFRARASETDNTTWTPTTDFTGLTNATADAGAAAVGSSANGEFRIITSTSQTSDPTKTSSDGSDIFIALWEGNQSDSSPWVVSGNQLQSGAGTTTPPWVLGHEPDDIALLVCESLNGEAVTLTTANGFAEVPSSPQDVSASRLTVFWCRATGTSMASPVTNDPGDHINNHMYLIRGCHNSGDPWNVMTGTTGASSTSVTCPDLTTTVDRCLILWICSQGTDLSTDEFSGWANTGSTRFEELDAISTTAGNGGGHGIAYGYKASAGAVGTATATLATASGKGMITIAFKPQTGGAQSYNDAVSVSRTESVSDRETRDLQSLLTLAERDGVTDGMTNSILSNLSLAMVDGVSDGQSATIPKVSALNKVLTLSDLAGVGVFPALTLIQILSTTSANFADMQGSVGLSGNLGIGGDPQQNINPNASLLSVMGVNISGGLSLLSDITIAERLGFSVLGNVGVYPSLTLGKDLAFVPANIALIGGSVSVGQALGFIDVPNLDAQAALSFLQSLGISLSSALSTQQVEAILTLAHTLGLTTSAQLNVFPLVGIDQKLFLVDANNANMFGSNVLSEIRALNILGGISIQENVVIPIDFNLLTSKLVSIFGNVSVSDRLGISDSAIANMQAAIALGEVAGMGNAVNQILNAGLGISIVGSVLTISGLNVIIVKGFVFTSDSAKNSLSTSDYSRTASGSDSAKSSAETGDS